MTRTVVTGIGGRMGQVLARLVEADAAMTLVHGTDRAGGPHLGQDLSVFSRAASPSGIRTVASLEEVLASAKVDAVIDFTSPEASLAHAKLCAAKGVALVIGSTGFTPAHKAELEAFARTAPMVVAPNMSVGVNVVIEAAARLARELGEDFDIDIVESHHRMKKDAPSGTALRIAEEIASATGRTSADFRTSREGQIGERRKGEIGLQTLRGGDVVGEHTVFFFGEGERVELTHRATDRAQFAHGALRAAKWLQGKPARLYGMRDVLGLGGANAAGPTPRS